MEEQICKSKYVQQGIWKTRDGYHIGFSVQKETDCCGIWIYPNKQFESGRKISIPQSYRKGRVYAIHLKSKELKGYFYLIEINGHLNLHEYSTCFSYLEEKNGNKRKASLFTERKKQPDIDVLKLKPENLILYKLQVRGFTKADAKTKEKNAGTFKGVIGKIPYFQKLGINSILFMPIYEHKEEIVSLKGPSQINFWGYGLAYYFAVNQQYAIENPLQEFADSIHALHLAGIACFMEIYFPKGVKRNLILSTLYYWVLEYNIDGFHLQGENLPVDAILEDELLSDTTFIFDYYTKENVLIYGDEFYYPLRKILNGYGGNIQVLLEQMFQESNRILYLADQNGFTLWDLFSYEKKHNEENRELGMDGPKFNYSCNFGKEGISKSRKINDLRVKMVKNALMILLLSKGSPMIMSGDEDKNSQFGNNNAYCQDNGIGWKDWQESTHSKSIFDFCRQMIYFRNEHDVMTKKEAYRFCDYIHCKLPDLSYHGESAWLTFGLAERKSIGILYSGAYGIENKEDIYVAINFSWNKEILALPLLGEEKQWFLKIDTSQKESFLSPLIQEEQKILLDPMTIYLYIGREKNKENKEFL